MFLSPVGSLRNHGNLQDIVRSLDEQVGIEALTPKELRHSAASLLVEEGASVVGVADLLGHTNLTMSPAVLSGSVNPKHLLR